MLYKFYKAQQNNPANGDWVNQLEKDKQEFNITYKDEDLKSISKYSFKKEIKTKANLLAIDFLQKLKDKHSKTDNIKIKQELNISEYLRDKDINPEQAKFIFKIRTRMYPVKCNFKTQYKMNYLCDLCKQEDENQEHLLKCKVLLHFVPELKDTIVQYKDIFGNIDEVKEASKLLYKVCKEREALLELCEDNQSQYLITTVIL